MRAGDHEAGGFALPTAHEASGHEPYRSIVEGIAAVSYVETVVAGRATSAYVGPQIRSMLGFSPEEWRADPDLRWRRAHPEDRNAVHRLILSAREDGSPFQTEYRVATKDGAEVWVNDLATPVPSPGRAATVYGLLIDVTDRRASDHERRIAESTRFVEALHQNEQQFHQLFSASPDAIVLIDPHHPTGSWPIVDCNEVATTMNGYSREELIGTSIDSLNTTKGTPAERAAYLERLRREGVISLETFHRHRGGHIFPVEVSTSLVNLGGRELLLGIDRDISERKRMEQALRVALESERQSVGSLRELDQMKNTFLTAVSHDLRTPLTALLGSALTLERLRETLSTMEQDQLIHAISSNAQRLQRMLSDLLDMDRLTRGAMEPEATPTDLAALLHQLVEESDIRDDHVVHVDVEPMILELDAPKVGRIIDNLLVNARRHTGAGTEVWVAARIVDGGVLLIVEDAGPGVPETSRRRIFQPFTQLGDHSDGSPGVGIGLALVARFSELHGGRAWVEERPGGGASFKVFLPTPDRAQAAPAAARSG